MSKELVNLLDWTKISSKRLLKKNLRAEVNLGNVQ